MSNSIIGLKSTWKILIINNCSIWILPSFSWVPLNKLSNLRSLPFTTSIILYFHLFEILTHLFLIFIYLVFNISFDLLLRLWQLSSNLVTIYWTSPISSWVMDDPLKGLIGVVAFGSFFGGMWENNNNTSFYHNFQSLKQWIFQSKVISLVSYVPLKL